VPIEITQRVKVDAGTDKHDGRFQVLRPTIFTKLVIEDICKEVKGQRPIRMIQWTQLQRFSTERDRPL